MGFWKRLLRVGISQKDRASHSSFLYKKYTYWRIRIFLGMYVGYIFYYFSRKSFTFIMPLLMLDLGLQKTDLGMLGSVLSIAYGISKFVSGVISDRANPRYFMALGLFFTGLINILFGLSSTLSVFVVLWGINGWFQGWGWPPCARLLTHWYSHKERGTWWGLWNTSHSVGGALIPLLAAFSAHFYGWRWGMYIPGIICIGMSICVFIMLRDTPQSLGLPSVEEFRDDYEGVDKKSIENPPAKQASFWNVLKSSVLNNHYIWILAFAYFCIYAVRTAINDWTALFLVESRGYSVLVAGSCLFWFEIGGILGSLSAGLISDRWCDGCRGPVNVFFSAGIVSVLLLLFSSTWMPIGLVADSMLLFCAGFFVFGPQMLIGMVAAELAGKHAAGAATGFVGLLAYFGAAAAGYPLGWIVHHWGWVGFFFGLVGVGFLGMVLLIPLWGVSFSSNQEDAPEME